MTEQQKDSWLREHTDIIVAEKDLDMEITDLIQILPLSYDENKVLIMDDNAERRNALVNILNTLNNEGEKDKRTIEQINQLREEAHNIFSKREIVKN